MSSSDPQTVWERPPAEGEELTRPPTRREMEKQELQPWQRQKRESQKAYEAFVVYRTLGKVRSLDATAREMGKSRTLMERWSSKWSWVKRAEAWDLKVADDEENAEVQSFLLWRKQTRRISQQALGKIAAALQTLEPEDIPPHAIATIFRTAVDVGQNSWGEQTTMGPSADVAPMVRVEFVEPSAEEPVSE